MDKKADYMREVIRNEEDAGAGTGGGSSGSSIVQRAVKAKAKKAKLDSELKHTAAVLGGLTTPADDPEFEQPKPSTSKKSSAKPKPGDEEKKANATASLLEVIGKYKELIRKNPKRYGNPDLPDVSQKSTTEELLAVRNQLRLIVQKQSATTQFNKFFDSIPKMLEMLSATGKIALNLYGLKERFGDDDGDELSLTTEMRAIREELAVEWADYFRTSPELRYLILMGGTVLETHQSNVRRLAGMKNRTPDQEFNDNE